MSEGRKAGVQLRVQARMQTVAKLRIEQAMVGHRNGNKQATCTARYGTARCQ